jgi:GT2 family glycosyltransferase
MFTIITVYNKEQVVKKHLLSSLKKQSAEYELILLDNSQNKYLSAAEALNSGFNQAKKQNKYLMFVHQDVEFPTIDWLSKTENYLDNISDLGIAGVAGMVDYGETNEQRGRGLVKEGEKLIPWHWSKQIEKPEKVQTIDECVIIIPRSVFEQQKFDEEVCDHWHLYAVDYCLSVKKISLSAYVIPQIVYHYSGGIADKNYYRCLKKVLKKHKTQYPRIYTTCGDFSTKSHLYFQKPGLILKYFE